MGQSPTMASKSAQFFMNGTNKQFEFVFSKYQEALQAKADSKNSKSEVLLKLDKWYQNELPKKIKSRGKESHLTHEELVQLIKWKLARGVFRPRLKDLIQMNTPRVVMQETKKAFRAIDKRKDIEAAVSALSNLKGVGPAMASAVLAAMAPELAPFMADECLLSMPEVEGIDYTMKEYMKLVEKTKECVERLNAQGGDWNPHKVELTLWSFFVLRENKPDVLDDLPAVESEAKRAARENGLRQEVSKEAGEEPVASEPASNGSPEPETCTDQQPLETPGAESQSPAQQTDTSNVEPQTPVESQNGNGHTEHLEQEQEQEQEAVAEPAQTKRTLEDPEPAAAAPESKRPCTESDEREETPAAAPPPPAAPNGVNSNPPQPISSGGD